MDPILSLHMPFAMLGNPPNRMSVRPDLQDQRPPTTGLHIGARSANLSDAGEESQVDTSGDTSDKCMYVLISSHIYNL